MVMSVSGWVWQENVLRLMRHLASITGYEFDSLDADAVETGLLQSDAEEDAWFDYPLCGSRRLDVFLARDPNAFPVAVRVAGDLDELLTARIRTLLAVLSDPR